MAVALKNSPDTSMPSVFDRLPVAILAGVVFVVAGLAAVFKGLPHLWWNVLGFNRADFVMVVLLFAIITAAVVGLFVLGARLLGPRPVPGLKAGIFFVLVGLLLIGVVTRWIGLLLENLSFQHNWFGAVPTVGMLLTAVVGLGLLFFAARTLFKPGLEKWLIQVEDQGWFGTNSYKKAQGLRVRRGTMLAIIFLIGCGIYTMLAHKALAGGSTDWEVNVPFTGKVVVQSAGDTRLLPKQEAWAPEAVVDRYAFRDVNALLSGFVKVEAQNDSKKFEPQTLAPKREYEEEAATLKEAGEDPAKVITPSPASGTTRFETFSLLPDVKLTVPLLLAGLALWFAWRLVNMPAFADFLIATEAELNKVSWSTRRRLVQDTIVVLITVALFTLFLLAVDLMWGFLLRQRFIGVLQVDQKAPEQQSSTVEQPW